MEPSDAEWEQCSAYLLPQVGGNNVMFTPVFDLDACICPPPDNTQGKEMDTRKIGSARFHEIVKELGTLHDQKQADYGSDSDPYANVRASEEWGLRPWLGAMLRISDKIHRLRALAKKGKLANESAEDSLRDIAVYAIIALILYESDYRSEKCV